MIPMKLESAKIVTRLEDDSVSPSRVQSLILAVATGLGMYLCYLLATLFLPALTGALALAVLFTPFQRWLEAKLKRPNLAAVVAVLAIGMSVAVPATFVAQRLAVQAVKGAELVQTKVKSGEWRRALNAQPRLAVLAEKIEQQFDLPGTVTTLATWLSTTAGTIVKGSLYQVIGFCLTFYLLFFFLRDRDAALLSFRSVLPFSEVIMDRLFSRIGDTIYATIYGTLAVASAQGMLGGLMFWWLGLSAPLLWGVVMALLAVVPVLGAFIVWIPAALFLVLEGNWGKALILALWGMFVVGTVDNILRPILVGNRLKLHTVLAFMSVVGGLIVFGPAGLLLGPLALTVTTVLLEIWRGRMATETPVPIEPE